MLTVRTTSLAGTHAVAAAIAGLAKGGDLIVLAGEMGAGKTAFAQGFGAALGVKEPITSPTFTLVHTYECGPDSGRIDLHHADLYRLDRTGEVADLALGELLESNGIVLVEWGDVLGNTLGDRLVLHLGVGEDDALMSDGGTGSPVRDITIRPYGSTWARRWGALEAAVDGATRC